MIQFLANNEKGINLPTGWVPDSTYWLINEENRILGVVNIRHELTDFLLTRGGHTRIWYSSIRKKKGICY